MEQVVLNGITYSKASDVAEQFGYTSDYVGQLCRGGDVKCRKVGRAWFVDISSVVDYRANRHRADDESKTSGSDSEAFAIPVRRMKESAKKSRIDENKNNNLKNKAPKTEQKVSIGHDNKKYKIDVHPRSAKIIYKEPTPDHFLNRISWKPVAYESDSEDLFPAVPKKAEKEELESKENKPEQSVKIPVNPPNAKPVTVRRTTENYNMESSELPKIPLNGVLKVESYEPPEIEEVDQNSFKNKAIPQSQKQLINPQGNMTIPKVPPRPMEDNQTVSKSVEDIPESQTVLHTSELNSISFENPSEHNESADTSSTDHFSELSEPLVVHKTSLLPVAGGTLLAAVIIALTLISLEGSVLATGDQFTEHLKLDFSWLR